MARAFRAASPLPVPSSSSRAAGGNSGGGGGNFPWPLIMKLLSKAPRGGTGGQEGEGVGDEAETTAARFSAPSSSAEHAEVRSSLRKRADALARMRSAFLAAITHRLRRRQLGSSVTGTIFGRRRGRVHVALQTDTRSPPALLVEMAAYSTGALVREMSSGLVRLALECEKAPLHAGTSRSHHTHELASSQTPVLTLRRSATSVQARSGGRCWRSRHGEPTATDASAATRCAANAAPTNGGFLAPSSLCPSAPACSLTTPPPARPARPRRAT
ncbi:hypothetical protein GUJ93_ZPchr0006g43308 [Zizania palustris]|uniref:Uncharacterized protein n=1 Tax=Zizania palustris TaxID=103762 RepID=A0A8J5W205_ZIZPA|nr:hypothetical protein GUJ93_ZPchr0006g43308 [Zizania palustris]